ncbi:MAG TPA: hypothetical protein VN729_05065, partial [Ktedonobacteraceae bacterium]|nr:hypothetical protein [Ktedonobacteraceae bacterium]
MMSLSYITSLVFALLIIVLAGFIAVPALHRLVRNIYLTRKGRIATGRYLSSNRAIFFLETKKRIEFTTWRKSSASGKEIEVLYNPEQL